MKIYGSVHGQDIGPSPSKTKAECIEGEKERFFLLLLTTSIDPT